MGAHGVKAMAMVTGLAVCSRTFVDSASDLKSRRKTRLNARGASSRFVKAALTREKRVSTKLRRVASHYATIWGMYTHSQLSRHCLSSEKIFPDDRIETLGPSPFGPFQICLNRELARRARRVSRRACVGLPSRLVVVSCCTEIWDAFFIFVGVGGDVGGEGG